MANLLNLSGVTKQANALARNAKSQLSSSINSIKGGLGLGSGPSKNFLASESGAPLYFPIDLDLTTGPHTVKFKVKPNGKGEPSQSVYFPCPANISFNDSATYNTIDLNTLGGTLKTAADEGLSQGQGALGIAGNVLKRGTETVKNLKGSEVAAAAASNLPPLPFPGQAGVRAAGRQLGKTIFNPNTNTTFTGNAIRTFSFSFKMISSSDKESQRIIKIHNLFRKYAYADSDPTTNNLFLKFPPTWEIEFMDKGGARNVFIPKIFDCYLISLETNFNSTTNMFHGDGAPLEVDVNLTYQETRVLNRSDIVNSLPQDTSSVTIHPLRVVGIVNNDGSGKPTPF